jgi:hypothetical protein
MTIRPNRPKPPRRGGRYLLTTWEQAAAQLDGVAPFGSVPAAAFAFGDAVVHEADLRPVLEPGTRVPVHAVTDALAAGVARWRSVLSAAAVPALHLGVPGVRWNRLQITLESGEPWIAMAGAPPGSPYIDDDNCRQSGVVSVVQGHRPATRSVIQFVISETAATVAGRRGRIIQPCTLSG